MEFVASGKGSLEPRDMNMTFQIQTKYFDQKRSTMDGKDRLVPSRDEILSLKFAQFFQNKVHRRQSKIKMCPHFGPSRLANFHATKIHAFPNTSHDSVNPWWCFSSLPKVSFFLSYKSRLVWSSPSKGETKCYRTPQASARVCVVGSRFPMLKNVHAL